MDLPQQGRNIDDVIADLKAKRGDDARWQDGKTFGLVFEMPLVILMLVRMGVVTTGTLRRSRPYAVVVICILSALLTPQDPFSMVAMAIPMLILYEISLWSSTVVERRVAAAEKKMADS